MLKAVMIVIAVMTPDGWEPLTPAYGRDYKTAKAVKEDFFGRKDFITAGGQYCSVDDFKDQKAVPIRFSKLTKVVHVDATKEK